MKLSDFDYELPPEQIAQQPVEQRDASRLLVLDRTTGALEHHEFHELDELLRPEDLLVFNDTRVRPARLVGRKESGGRVELLLVEKLDGSDRTAIWRCMLGAGRKPAVLSWLDLGQGLRAQVLEHLEGAEWRVLLESEGPELDALLDRVGQMPLPPYIHRDSDELEPLDRERYQTVYAANPGAVAAPTAGLHFTVELLERLRERGVGLAHLTLHVGPGTFLPVRTEEIEDHRMHGEWFDVPETVAEAVERTRERGGRVVAVGTTVVRALEASAAGGRVEAGQGYCELFIYPGFRFQVVDALITNFHLPRSTLLMLVSAFAGTERVLEAYRTAVESGYRFYSYGDATLLS